VAIVVMVVVTIVAFWIEGSISPWSPDFSAQALPASLVHSNDPQVINGAQLFHDKGCEFCHTVDGRGGLRGPNLTDAGLRLNVNDIKIRILNGGGNMPAFAGILTAANLDDLVAFLESRVRQPGRTSRAEDAAGTRYSGGDSGSVNF
jgi:ubiquinol-cytochrome c reductase cytochrome b subunit